MNLIKSQHRGDKISGCQCTDKKINIKIVSVTSYTVHDGIFIHIFNILMQTDLMLHGRTQKGEKRTMENIKYFHITRKEKKVTKIMWKSFSSCKLLL